MAFIKIPVDTGYYNLGVITALINIDLIEIIRKFTPIDDDEFEGTEGSLILMNTGNEYVTMKYNVDQLMEMIEEKLKETNKIHVHQKAR